MAVPLGRKTVAPTSYPKVRGGPGMDDDEYFEVEHELGWGVRSDARANGQVLKKGITQEKLAEMTSEERNKSFAWHYSRYMETIIVGMVRRVHVRIADEFEADGVTPKWWDAPGISVEDAIESFRGDEMVGTKTFMEWLFEQIQEVSSSTATDEFSVAIKGASGKRKKATFQEATA